MRRFLILAAVIPTIAVMSLLFTMHRGENASGEETEGAPRADAPGSAATLTDPASRLSALSTKAQVIEQLGLPQAVDATGTRWTFNDRVVIFRGDRVVGWATGKDTPSQPAPQPQFTAKPYQHRRLRLNQPAWSDRAQVVYGDTVSHSGGPRVFAPRHVGRGYHSQYWPEQHGYSKHRRTEYGRQRERAAVGSVWSKGTVQPIS